jgi:uncharacterized protein (UPF0335 family)
MANVYGIAGDLLKQIIEKIERLEHEKSEIATHIKDVYAEAKSSGLEPKIIKQIIKERKMDSSDLEEQELILVSYKRALGMLPELDETA